MKQAGAACSAATTPGWEMWRKQHAVPAIQRSTLPQRAQRCSGRHPAGEWWRRTAAHSRAIRRQSSVPVWSGWQQIQALDLFPVASLKRDKSGGMEVHFFDRLKALTTLFEKSSEADGKNAAASLLAALGGTGDADDAV